MVVGSNVEEDVVDPKLKSSSSTSDFLIMYSKMLIVNGILPVLPDTFWNVLEDSCSSNTMGEKCHVEDY